MGKTSLKNLLGTILCKYYRTYVSPKSFNNHFGVPLSLSNLNFDHKYGVFEIGMSRSGEINSLSRLVRPNVGIITNIAEAHIENFKNITGIAKAMKMSRDKARRLERDALAALRKAPQELRTYAFL